LSPWPPFERTMRGHDRVRQINWGVREKQSEAARVIRGD
jgi:hypothetical protein